MITLNLFKLRSIIATAVFMACGWSTLPAQSSGSTVADSCTDTLSTRYKKRMRLVVEYGGSNRREMIRAIELAAAGSTHCILVESGGELNEVHLIQLKILRKDDGGYEAATSVSYVGSDQVECRSARAASVRGDSPIVWGVALSQTVKRLIECAFGERPSNSAAPP